MGASIDVKGGGCVSPYALGNMERLIDKSTDKYICLYNLFIVRGA